MRPRPHPRKLRSQRRFGVSLGGEEFVLLLPRTPLDTALSLAETIRVSVAKVSISGLPRFTVSIGVAHHEGNESIDELFKRVDDALYRAKNDGRNRVLAA